jgi:adenylate cyclase
VDELARDVTRIPQHSHVVSGTCLATDVDGYTSISETLDPAELRLIMNEYYASVFVPVAAHRGIVSDVVGDAMVAIWAAATDSASLREQACRAAVEIGAAAEAFGRTPHRPALPTRIGLDSGRMALGNVGGISHYEYRAVGDIVNTASRIQGLNKVLGTRILMSAAVFEGTSGLVARHLGEFRLRGKSNPVSIYELAAIEPRVGEEQRWLCSTFETAVDALRARRWKDAEGILLDVIARFPHDGPARFYLEWLKHEHAGPEHWDGVVAVGSD